MVATLWNFSVGLIAFVAMLGFMPLFFEKLANGSMVEKFIAAPLYLALTIFVVAFPSWRLGIAATHILIPEKGNANSL